MTGAGAQPRGATDATGATRPDPVRALATPGCLVLGHAVRGDARGWFAKPFDALRFAALGLPQGWSECFVSESRRGVIRGFHLQLPPSDHEKLVWVTSGAAFSVVLDLRRGSPQYGLHEVVRLDPVAGEALYVPRGVAHAFQATADATVMAYLVTSAHDPMRDAGVRWDSAGVEWPLSATAVSTRDRELPALADFDTPFRIPP